MYNKKPFLSIITITYNNSDGLKKTLESIAIQKEKDYELIIVDGKSTDNTNKIVEEYANIISYYICEKDRGIADALNKGTLRANGYVINYLNSGDCYLHENIITIVKKSYENQKWKWAYGLRQRIDKNNNIFLARKSEIIPYSFSNLVKSTLLISHQATFFELSMLKKIGLYDEKFQFLVMDYELMLRIGKKYTPVELAKYLVLYEDFGISANQLFNSLKLKHAARVKNLHFTKLEIVIDYLNIYKKTIVAKIASFIKKILLQTKFGKEILNRLTRTSL